MDRRELIKAAALAPLAVIPGLAAIEPDDPPPPRLVIACGHGDNMAQAWYKTSAWLEWLERHRNAPDFDAAYEMFKADMVRFRDCNMRLLG